MKKQSKRIVAKRTNKKWTVKAVKKHAAETAVALENVRNELKAKASEADVRDFWFELSSTTAPGLYVQQSRPGGIRTYDVVRIVSVNNGLFTRVGVFTPDQKEEHNPLIVCHSSYQAIQE